MAGPNVCSAPGSCAGRVLDVHGGCPSTIYEVKTTADLARAVGPSGQVLGLDISQGLIDTARAQKLPNARFEVGDATAYAFDAGRYDLLYSRFGVMFFGDPVAAFANLRRALKPAGRVAFVCWRTPQENPWGLVPLRAAMPHLPPMERPGPEDPGQVRPVQPPHRGARRRPVPGRREALDDRVVGPDHPRILRGLRAHRHHGNRHSHLAAQARQRRAGRAGLDDPVRFPPTLIDVQPAEAERITGYHVGGISPLGQRKRVRVFIEAAAMAHPTIIFNGGRRGLQIEIPPQELVKVLGLRP